MIKYKLLQSDTMGGLERMVNDALASGDMVAHGSPSEIAGRKVQAIMSAPEASPGGETNEAFGGSFFYDNSAAAYKAAASSWVDLRTNAAGPRTDTSRAPKGVTSMIDPATGRITFDGLKVGDRVYVKHILALTPYVNGARGTLRNVFDRSNPSNSEPFGAQLLLDGGAGTEKGPFSCESQFYIRDQASLSAGVQPQINVTAECDVRYISTYIVVSRT